MDIVQREGKYLVLPGISIILGVEFSGLMCMTWRDEVLRAVSRSFVEGESSMALLPWLQGAYAEYVNQVLVFPKQGHLTWVEASFLDDASCGPSFPSIDRDWTNDKDSAFIHAAASGVGDRCSCDSNSLIMWRVGSILAPQVKHWLYGSYVAGPQDEVDELLKSC